MNQMDASNLGIVFSPTVFRSDQSDIMKVLAEAKTAQVGSVYVLPICVLVATIV